MEGADQSNAYVCFGSDREETTKAFVGRGKRCLASSKNNLGNQDPKMCPGWHLPSTHSASRPNVLVD
ncbi:hypothetical protein BRADI_4g29675v3 [Brachypodium distachyon]|uniref:Uncharacterized protein n=1 Tax=Brachypodium distachyon TaxID=15368 RepID=A0A2K2CR63_BRADI|nr:hypothetical protein BRADI_4g29675v3 [Brachypodium distachyon]